MGIGAFIAISSLVGLGSAATMITWRMSGVPNQQLFIDVSTVAHVIAIVAILFILIWAVFAESRVASEHDRFKRQGEAYNAELAKLARHRLA